MLLELLGLPKTPLNLFLSLAVGGVIAYFLVSGASYWFFFVWGRKRFHPDFEPDWAADRVAMKWGTLGNLGNAALMLPLSWGIAAGRTHMYWDLSERSLLESVGWCLLYLAFTETVIYWAHRWLHTVPVFWDKLHRIHHQWKSTTSWVSMAFHPLDSFAQALPHHLAAFLFPVPGPFYYAMLVGVMLWSAIIHDRTTFVRLKLLNYTDHHTVHHWLGDFNLGQYTTIWDRIMGTWRDPDVEAAKDPGLAAAMGPLAQRGIEAARQRLGEPEAAE